MSNLQTNALFTDSKSNKSTFTAGTWKTDKCKDSLKKTTDKKSEKLSQSEKEKSNDKQTDNKKPKDDGNPCDQDGKGNKSKVAEVKNGETKLSVLTDENSKAAVSEVPGSNKNEQKTVEAANNEKNSTTALPLENKVDASDPKKDSTSDSKKDSTSDSKKDSTSDSKKDSQTEVPNNSNSSINNDVTSSQVNTDPSKDGQKNN